MQQETAVDQLIIRGSKRGEMCMSWCGRLAQQHLRDMRNAWPRYTHDTDASRARSAGNGGDGVFMENVGGHGRSA